MSSVANMRTFYIFKIKTEYSKLTKDLPDNLYYTFLKMRLSQHYNLAYVTNQYQSIIANLNRDDLSHQLSQQLNDSDGYMIYRYTHMYNNYYSDEVSKLTIYRSFLILKSNKPNSTFFTLLYQIPHLFVIDFENKDYFWLGQMDNLRLVNP